MNVKKLLFVAALFFGSNHPLFAMNADESKQEQSLLDNNFHGLPMECMGHILDYVRSQPKIPADCLRASRELAPFTQASRECRLLSLHHQENKIINPLIKFDGKQLHLNGCNVVDFVSACCAYKMIIDRRSCITLPSIATPRFCPNQFQALNQFFKDRDITVDAEDKPGEKSNLKDRVLALVPPLLTKIRKEKKRGLQDYFDNELCDEALFHAIIYGEDLDQLDGKTGYTALIHAVMSGDLVFARMLLLAGAHVDTKASSESEIGRATALHFAAGGNSPELVTELLSWGANPDVCVLDKELRGQTALHIAANAGYLGVITHLVRGGAWINKRNGLNGLTAFHLAALHNNVALLKLLLELGADPHVQFMAGGHARRADALSTDPEVRNLVEQACGGKPKTLKDYERFYEYAHAATDYSLGDRKKETDDEPKP